MAATVFPLSQEWVKRAILMIIPHRYFVRRMFFWLLEDIAQNDEASRKVVESWVEEIFMALRSFIS